MNNALSVEELKNRIIELEAEIAQKSAMIALLFDHSPHGVTIVDAQGTARVNPKSQEIMGMMADAAPRDQWSAEFGFFHPDKVTPVSPEELGLNRALKGESVEEELVFVRTPYKPQGIFLQGSSRPLPGGGAIVVSSDVTEKRELAQQLERSNAELAARDEDNRDLIARLRVAVEELSTPVLEVWDDVLALPVVGVVDTQRSAQMTEKLLTEVVRSRSRHVIVDLTGVEVIDTSTADRFLKLARSVNLLGARCLITGIQPAVAQTLVELGVEFGSLETHRNLKNALQACVVQNRNDARQAAQKQ